MEQGPNRQAPAVKRVDWAKVVAPLAAHPDRHPASLHRRKEPAYWFASYVKGDLAGIGCLMRLPGNRWRLCGLFVLPDHQGAGIGTGLIIHRYRFAALRGAKVIDTTTARVSMFERLGFMRVEKFLHGDRLERRLR